MSTKYVLEMKGISKSFFGVQALGGVDLFIREGSVHALLGENGAGKSTLTKILYGIYQPDEGEVIFKGQPYLVKSPREAMERGVSLIPQEISPVPNLRVADNIFLGKEITSKWGGFVKQRRIEEETQALFDELGIGLDPCLRMSDVSIAGAQLVAIATALSYDADLLIMDEPTSALTEGEIDKLYKIIHNLKEKKKIGILYISHKLDEIFTLCDEVSVLRDGKYIDSDRIENLDQDRLISLMIGRSLPKPCREEEERVKGDILLEVKNLSLPGKFEDISFSLKQGEVLGVAGLVGAGRTELMEALFGYTPPESGEILLKGKRVAILGPMDAIRQGIAFVTEDRNLTGLFPELSVKDNIILPSLGQYLKKGFLDNRRIKETCQAQKEAMTIKTPTLEQLIKNLSGGNQQKALLARWLLMTPEILILDEPTRGIDLGAKAEIHRLICELTKKGTGILMVSSEMPEILSISDRILVLHEGRSSGEISREEATQEKILRLVTGGKSSFLKEIL